MQGIDISEHNGAIDWDAVKDAGMAFAIIRLGWGRGHLDTRFYENVNGALAAGLATGVYYYSYALTEEEARTEADFAAAVLADAGLSARRLPMGAWLDMEDADGWKGARTVLSPARITTLSRAFLEEMEVRGYPCGVYASYDWLTRLLRMEELPRGTPVWCAQWGRWCGYPSARIWQYTDSLMIGGRAFDGDVVPEPSVFPAWQPFRLPALPCMAVVM